jgi:hypothetical protein
VSRLLGQSNRPPSSVGRSMPSPRKTEASMTTPKPEPEREAMRRIAREEATEIVRRALDHGLEAAERAPFCDPEGPSCSGYRAALATLTTPASPVEPQPCRWPACRGETCAYMLECREPLPQPAATRLEMPKPFAHVDDTHDEDARRFTGLCLRSLTASQGDPIYHAEQVERLLSEANAAIAAAEARGAAQQTARIRAWLEANRTASDVRVFDTACDYIEAEADGAGER